MAFDPLDSRGWGCELEVQGLSAAYTQQLIDMGVIDYSWQTHNDGSCRVQTYTLDGVPVIPVESTKYGRVLPYGAEADDGEYGYELVSPVLSSGNVKRIASDLGFLLSPTKYYQRSSIHIHRDMAGRSWREVQRLCRWFVALEIPIYKIAAGGRQHRGEAIYINPRNGERDIHDHNYARPISQPIAILNRIGNTVPLVNTKELLKAKTASDFIAAWGRMDVYWGAQMQSPWHPWRLMGLNVESINKRGTAEWRVFNATYKFLPLFFDLVAGIHHLAEQELEPDFKALLIGQPTKMTDLDMLGLVNDLCSWDGERVDFAPAWSDYPLRGCSNLQKLSHYNNSEFILPSANRRVIMNNSGLYDTDNDPDFPLYVRYNLG